MDGYGEEERGSWQTSGEGTEHMRGICGMDKTHKVANTPTVQGSQGHQSLTWDVLTLSDGEVDPIDLLKNLHFFLYSHELSRSTLSDPSPSSPRFCKLRISESV